MFFDLDGTLWDASESTALAWSEVFKRWGFASNIDQDQIRSVAGRPYLECLKIISPEAACCTLVEKLLLDLSIAEQQAMNKIGGVFYPGVIEGLEELCNLNSIYLVSNCNEWYMNSFFKQIENNNLKFKDSLCHGSTGLTKKENLLSLIRKYPECQRFYIGDTEGDKISAESAGLKYIHATYGYAGNKVSCSLSFDNFKSIVDFLKKQ